MARDFAKPAKTFEEQVQLLQSRGMIIDDVQDATFYLQHLNYYRDRGFSSYFLIIQRDWLLWVFLLIGGRWVFG